MLIEIPISYIGWGAFFIINFFAILIIIKSYTGNYPEGSRQTDRWGGFCLLGIIWILMLMLTETVIITGT